MQHICTKCHRSKPASEFGKRSNGKRNPKCKACVREYNRIYRATRRANDPEYRQKTNQGLRLRRYGVTQAQLDERWERQGKRCAICRRRREYVIDHCHITQEWRGLLCGPCNTAIGIFDDNIEWLQNAIHYLQGSQPQSPFRQTTHWINVRPDFR